MEKFTDQKEYKISWVKVLCILAIIALIIIIICLVYPKKNNSNLLKVYNSNLQLMKEAGYDYFKDTNLPSKIGETKTITLDEMIASKLITTIYDENGKTCKGKDSYLEVTKKSDNEYSLKVALDCENKDDYIMTTIITKNSEEEPKNEDKTSNSGQTTQSSNNVVQKVTKYYITYANGSDCPNCANSTYYSVIFESNGGSYVAKQLVEKGKLATEKIPTRDGYSFLGWYTDRDFTTKYTFTEPVVEKITLYAKWAPLSQEYNTYCKIVKDTYYSVSYTEADGIPRAYSWTMKFDNIKNTNNLKITEVGYLNNDVDYDKAYVKIATNKGLSPAEGDTSGEVGLTSSYMLKAYSLKAHNFTKTLSAPYFKDGYWYADASVNVTNYDNAVKYYAAKIDNYIYPVPFYFKVEYTDYNDCQDDLASNASKYSEYEVVKTYQK